MTVEELVATFQDATQYGCTRFKVIKESKVKYRETGNINDYSFLVFEGSKEDFFEFDANEKERRIGEHDFQFSMQMYRNRIFLLNYKVESVRVVDNGVIEIKVKDLNKKLVNLTH